ncbi:MAG: hypothetical protein V4720_06340 [Pseudomonadota bacterium]
MADRPIIFSAPMVRALLEGRKSQTRRVLNPQPDLTDADRVRCVEWKGAIYSGNTRILYAPGDRLYVREAWRTARAYDDLVPSEMAGEEPVKYEADGAEQMWGWPDLFQPGRYRHARFMPRWASRITLGVTEVRVQRLQEISEADAVAEGIERARSGRFYDPTVSRGTAAHLGGMHLSARSAYEVLWNSLHGPDAWDANPWVVAVSFTVERRNIDVPLEVANA